MGRRFHAASGQASGFDPEAFMRVIRACDQVGGYYRTKRGFIAGSLIPAWFDPGWLMAVEFAWWSEDGKGLWLLRKFEKWADRMGANEIRMTTLGAGNGESILRRRGYTLAEQGWKR